ncbi:spore protease YyaC [bacterium LRH843]|nr:spore protease YyaC [bacterium LRH843]
MSTNHRLFGKKYPALRVHMEEADAALVLSNQLQDMMAGSMNRDLVIVCIGTDRSTGDSLGPLVGSMLEQQTLRHFHVYGTLEKPVHAVNLGERLDFIQASHPRSFILAIDACLGRLSSVGSVSLAEGPVQPGAAVQKKLPSVGDIHITGVVNVGGMMEYFVLQNTRLHTVIQMAELIATAITTVDASLPVKVKTTSLFHTFKIKPAGTLHARKEEGVSKNRFLPF